MIFQKMSESVFSRLSDDIILNILYKLEDDPRHWARIACVSSKFASLVQIMCCKTKCLQTISAVVSDLLSNVSTSAATPPGGWASLYKLAVCCPGLLHSGVLLENSDFGLERELGPDENYQENKVLPFKKSETIASSSGGNSELTVSGSDCGWSLYDDLFFDTVYNASESSSSQNHAEMSKEQPEIRDREKVEQDVDFTLPKRRKICRSLSSHLASGVWNLSREQGNKLLASRFKGDCLYICNWPGCVHIEEKRNYMLFRGFFS